MKFFPIALAYVVLNISPVWAQTQKKIDSLTAIYNSLPDNEQKIRILSHLYDETEYTNPELSKIYVDKELKLAKKLNNVKEIGSAYYNLACFHFNKQNKDSVQFYLDLAAVKYEESNHEHGLTIVKHFKAILDYHNGKYDDALKKLEEVISVRIKRKEYSDLSSDYGFRGLIYQYKGYYKLALQSHLNGLKIIDTIPGEEFSNAQTLSFIAHLESTLDNIDNAIAYTERALRLYEKLDYVEYQALEKIDLVHYFNKLEKYNMAVKTANEAIDLGKKIESDAIVHDAYAELGWSLIKLKDFKRGIDYLKKSLAHREKVNEPVPIMHALHWLARSHTEMNEPDKSLTYLERAFKIADSIKDPKWFELLFLNRSNTYLRKNAFKNAIEDYKKSIAVRDSLTEVANNREIEELRIIYETEKKEQQIALQEKEITVLEQQASISNLQKLLLGIGFLLSLIGFYAIRQKLKRNKLEKEKVDAELAFKKKELTTHALHLAKKNEVLEGLKQKAQDLKEKEESKKGYQSLIRTINFDLQDDNNWQNFSRYFEEVHKDFNSNVKSKYPQVTANELRLMALLKMNLSSKEIANILNISQEGIKKARYRLRKKLDITTEDSLQDLVLNL